MEVAEIVGIKQSRVSQIERDVNNSHSHQPSPTPAAPNELDELKKQLDYYARKAEEDEREAKT